MNTILDDNVKSFKDLEKFLFDYLRKVACEIIKEFLEHKDNDLFLNRDKKVYRDKGLRQTTIKSVFGDIVFKRHFYVIEDSTGLKTGVYLLDTKMGLKLSGFYSPFLVDLCLNEVLINSFRKAAENISKYTGEFISAMSVWNITQTAGEYLKYKEKELIKQNKQGKLKGDLETDVLFEEADGVYISLQGRDRGPMKKSIEVKSSIVYTGWEKTGNNRYNLCNKTCISTIDTPIEFRKLREATINSRYNVSANTIRILNADGGAWTKNTNDTGSIFQLDPFHRNKAIKTYIKNKKAERDITDLVCNGEIDEVIEYIEIYINSITDDTQIKDAKTLLQYFKNNYDGMLPYQSKIKLPIPPKNIYYRNMGCMESNINSNVTYRMKHGHRHWSVKGANNMVKLIAAKVNGTLNIVADFLNHRCYENNVINEIKDKIDNNVIVKTRYYEKEGTGYEYQSRGSIAHLGNFGRAMNNTFDFI